jgi:hypothetical protein
MAKPAFQQAQDAYRAGKNRAIDWFKAFTGGATLGNFHGFGVAGQPAAGAYNGAAALAAQVITGGSSPSIVGGYSNFPDPTPPDQSNLTFGDGLTGTAVLGGKLLLLDLLVLYQGFSANSAAQQNTTGSAAGVNILPTRANGDSVFAFLDTQVAFGATPANVQFHYTRKDLTSGRLAPAEALVVSAAAGRVPHNSYLLPLQLGDADIVSVQDVTLSAAMGAGTFALWLAKVLGTIRIPVDNTPGESHFLGPDARNVRIPTGAALSWILIPSGAVAPVRCGGRIEMAMWDPAA